MTNYNERLNSIREKIWNEAHNHYDFNDEFEGEVEDIMNDITSLTKELVAEAKPKEYEDYSASSPVETCLRMGYNEAVREFEQNLLKTLEEV